VVNDLTIASLDGFACFQRDEDLEDRGGLGTTMTKQLDLEAIKARAKAATPGPWHVWDGPLYVGGGADLCIGAGDEWLANMDHRYGANYAERLDHDPATHAEIFGEGKDGKAGCRICSINEEATIEQQNNANFIAHARKDIPMLVAEVERLTEALEREKDLRRRVDELEKYLETYWYRVHYQLDDFYRALAYSCRLCEAEERTHDHPGASVYDMVMAIEHYDGCIMPSVLHREAK
jgi:hypothetical protein